MLFWISRDLSDTRGSRRRAVRKAERRQADKDLLSGPTGVILVLAVIVALLIFVAPVWLQVVAGVLIVAIGFGAFLDHKEKTRTS